MFGLGKIKALQSVLINAAVVLTVNTEQLDPKLLPAVAVAGVCLVSAKACLGFNKSRKQSDNVSKKPSKVPPLSNLRCCNRPDLQVCIGMLAHFGLTPICKVLTVTDRLTL